jgi:hypothetical protein
MRLHKVMAYLIYVLLFSSLFTPHEVTAGQDDRFSCGGSVETEVWTLWDKGVRDVVTKQQLQARLLDKGDVYALYDIQNDTQSVVSMASRCGRTSRLREIARLVDTAYGALEQGPPRSPARRWVCHGGSSCNEKNGLLGKEVMLDSLQFLVLASSVANVLATSGTQLTDEDKTFIRKTVLIVREHVLRWGDDKAIAAIQKAAKATPQDVEGDSPELLFLDRHLWMITLYAECAGILDAWERRSLGDIGITAGDKERFRKHLSSLLQFFIKRISLQKDASGRLGNVNLADLDRGYWRLFFDNRYAGYEGKQKPVVCDYLKNDKTKFTMDTVVPVDTVPIRQDIGWDISHARRLVPALDALERNREAMKKIYSISDSQLPATGLPLTFANTLVAVVWNGDENKPLFSNWWSGANGWYRVAYDNKTGQCREGYPPYGLTDTFATGGYAAWARYRPVIGSIGQRLYHLVSSPEGASSPFITQYYKEFSESASDQVRTLWKFMFFPSLVGVNNK